jgi:hypothetical protein
MNSLSDIQKSICQSFGASFLQCDELLKIGISKDFDSLRFPINGLRHPPQGDTTGWYIWSGEKYSEDPDFFVPLHTKHLNDRYPEIAKYLGLGPGWRFLIAPGQEDVWFDASLLRI